MSEADLLLSALERTVDLTGERLAVPAHLDVHGSLHPTGEKITCRISGRLIPGSHAVVAAVTVPSQPDWPGRLAVRVTRAAVTAAEHRRQVLMTYLGELSAGGDRRLEALVRCYASFTTLLPLPDGATVRVFCQIQEFCDTPLHQVAVGPDGDRLAAIRDLHELAVTIATLHDRYEIGHRDLLGNIMVREDGSWCLTDFGYAVHFDGQSQVMTDLVGKRGGWPPEFYAPGPVTISRSWDTWLFAHILFQRLTGTVPFSSPGQVLGHKPAAELKLLPAELQQLFLDATVVDPHGRLHMSEVAGRLGSYVAAEVERRRQARAFTARLQAELARAAAGLNAPIADPARRAGSELVVGADEAFADLEAGRTSATREQALYGWALITGRRWVLGLLLLIGTVLPLIATEPGGAYVLEAYRIYLMWPHRTVALPATSSEALRRRPARRLRLGQRLALAGGVAVLVAPGPAFAYTFVEKERDRELAQLRQQERIGVQTQLTSTARSFVNTAPSQLSTSRLTLGKATLADQDGIRTLTVTVSAVQSFATPVRLSFNCRRAPAKNTLVEGKKAVSIAAGPYLVLKGEVDVPEILTSSPSYTGRDREGRVLTIVPAPCTDPAMRRKDSKALVLTPGTRWQPVALEAASKWKRPTNVAHEVVFAVPRSVALPPAPVHGLRGPHTSWPEGTALGMFWVSDNNALAIDDLR